MPGGRPPYKLTDLRPDWREVIEKTYEEGGLDCHVRVALAIPPYAALSPDVWYDLLEREPEFSKTVNAGREKAMAWWMEQGRKGMWSGKAFNSRPWEVTMQNAFGLREKKDVTSDGKQINLTIAEDAKGL